MRNKFQYFIEWRLESQGSFGKFLHAWRWDAIQIAACVQKWWWVGGIRNVISFNNFLSRHPRVAPLKRLWSNYYKTIILVVVSKLPCSCNRCLFKQPIIGLRHLFLRLCANKLLYRATSVTHSQMMLMFVPRSNWDTSPPPFFSFFFILLMKFHLSRKKKKKSIALNQWSDYSIPFNTRMLL